MSQPTPDRGHRLLESKGALFTVLTVAAILVGTIVELVPMFMFNQTAAAIEAGIEPYTPLEVAGRDIYVREGCYTCHSQMIRPMRAEVMRYGEWSRSVEYAFDRPFQLGSRRIGPDLAREGGKRSDDWHWEHMINPRGPQPGSVMPSYHWLAKQRIDPEDIRASVVALQRLGTPYSDDEVAGVPAQLQAQGGAIVARLAEKGIAAEWDHELIAIIAYLQRLGVDGTRMLDAQAAAEGGQ